MRKLPSLKILSRNLIRLMSFCIVIICGASLIIYTYANTLVEKEYQERSKNLARETMDRVNVCLDQCRTISAKLMVDPMVQSFYATLIPGAAYDNYYKQIDQRLIAYTTGIDFIDSVYLYAPQFERVFADGSTESMPTSVRLFKDNDWLSMVEEQPDGVNYKVRSIENDLGRGFPFVLTVLLHRELNGVECVTVVNVDLQSLYRVVVSEQNRTIQSFLMDSEGRIVMQRVKHTLYGDPSEIPELVCFDAAKGEFTEMLEGPNGAYVYSQIPIGHGDLYSVSIMSSEEYVQKLSKTKWLIVTAAVVLSCVGVSIFMLFALRSQKEVRGIIELLGSPTVSDPTGPGAGQEMKYISGRIVSLVQTNRELARELDSRLKLLNDTRIRALQMQISPHFLYNTLNLVSMKISLDMGENHVTVTMLDKLAELLRYSLENTELVPLQKEAHYTRCYLDILLLRYRNTFDVVIDFSADIMEAMVPRLLLQPLIENAVFYGITGENGARGCVTVTGRKVPFSLINGKNVDAIQLSITDEGRGIEPAILDELGRMIRERDTEIRGKHIGVKNVANRLWLLYQDDFDMQIESEVGKGTKVTVTFPIQVNINKE